MRCLCVGANVSPMTHHVVTGTMLSSQCCCPIDEIDSPVAPVAGRVVEDKSENRHGNFRN